MARPLSRTRRLQDAAFLAALRRTGNVREAARIADVNRATVFKRRAADPAFAADWAAALTLAAASLRRGETAVPEPEIVRRHGGRLQLRRRPEGHLTAQARTAFLAALSASANVRLAEAARLEERARPSPHEPPPPALPDLAQVTGWSKADPAARPHDAERALFGGWRLWDWEGWEE